jgi:LacI family transcriptional regulator
MYDAEWTIPQSMITKSGSKFALPRSSGYLASTVANSDDSRLLGMRSRRKPLRIAVASELDWPLRRHYDLIAGIQEFADSHANWVVEVGPYPEVRMEQGVRLDGIVGRITVDTLAAANAAGIPVANAWRHSPVLAQIPSVLIDAYAAGRMAAEHLVARGFRRLALFQPRRRVTNDNFFAGGQAVAAANGYPCSQHMVSSSFERGSDVWRRTTTRLQQITQGWEAPIGVAVFTDGIGRALASILGDMGWRIPEDLALVSTGNEFLACAGVQPTLSSIDLGYHRNGFEAAALLHRLLEGESPPAAPILLPPKELVVRATSDVFAVPDPQVARALRYMADNSHLCIGVPDIAAATDLGRQVLERRFRTLLGLTINNELIRLRIERLKRLLVETDTPVKALGAEAGFGTPANMFQVFKDQTGMTPAAYRSQHADPRRW